MASSSNYGSDPTTPNTTFVQADPSNFRAVVQKLTGASEDPSAQKLPLTLPSRVAAAAQAQAQTIGPKKPNFKLQERRAMAKKLQELSIGVRSRGGALLMASPVSPLELLARSPHEEEEERAIAEKGFYLHPSPRSSSQPPQLLPLFPLHSPNSHYSHPSS